MLKMMRDSFQQLKWILIAIVAAFIFGFVYFDMGLGGAGGGRSDPQKDRAYAARVNGQTISRRSYDREYYFIAKNYEQMYRQPLTPEMLATMNVSKQVLDSLVDQQLILQEARRLHLEATPDEVRRRILDIQILNPDGKFVGDELYRRFLSSQGYSSPADFEDEMAREITLRKVESALTNSIIVSPKAAAAEYRRLSENAKIKYVLYPASREAASVTVTPAEVEAFYKANPVKYAHGEQRALKYLIVDMTRLRAQLTPSEAEVRKRYEATKEDYRRPESAHILHILIKVDPNAAPEADAAAKAKADDLVKQLRAGTDFAKLAQANSGDPSSSSKGGDMGFVDRGATVEPFDTAAFSIPLNQISDPIRSKEFGYHIIKVLERKPAGYRSFEEVKPQLMSQIAEQMAKDEARDEMVRLGTLIKQRKPKTTEEFIAFANDKASSNDTQWFAKSDPILGLGNNAKLANWAFEAKQGDSSDAIGTNRGPVIPYLYGIRPAGIAPLDEVRAKVEADARNAKAMQKAKEAVAKALPEPTLDAVGSKLSVTPAETTISRQGYGSTITGDTSELTERAMSAKVGEMVGPLEAGGGAVVFQVIDQHKVDDTDFDKNKSAYIENMRQQQARSLRQALLARLRKSAKIDVNSSILEQQQSRGAGGTPSGM